MKKIAVITPIVKSDYLANTVLDGLITLKKESYLDFKVTDDYPTPFPMNDYILKEDEFIKYAIDSDLIILAWGKNSTNFQLVEKINRWDKTIFIDGSETGKNNRFDQVIQNKIIEGKYDGIGAINNEMLNKCKAYFRREKPYINGIKPFPFGIETRYTKYFNKDIKKDIDFTCIFGQEDYPKMRNEARVMLEKFSKKNNFVCMTKKTRGFNFDDSTKVAGRDEFYEILARTKVGISIGGGGFDTARFWEILGNNCILLTEKIDIKAPEGKDFNYNRIHEFSNLEEFENKLAELGDYIRNSYNQDSMISEYNQILKDHSARSRVMSII